MCGVAGAIHPHTKQPVRATLVEFLISSSNGQYNLPDFSQFKNGNKICGFSHRTYASGRKTALGRAIASDATIKATWLNLKTGTGNDLKMQIPLENICNTPDGGYRDIYWLEPQEFDIANSFLAVPTSVLTGGEAYELVVYTIDANGC